MSLLGMILTAFYVVLLVFCVGTFAILFFQHNNCPETKRILKRLDRIRRKNGSI